MCSGPSEMYGRARLLCQPGSTLAGLASAVAPPRTLALEALESASLPRRCSSLCTQKKCRGFYLAFSK